MKRSKELSKQDKDGNPIWLNPNLSKADEAFYKTCQATQDGTLLKEFNKLKRSKELGGLFWDYLHTITIAHENSPNEPFRQVIFKQDIPKLITAIEKWAKERYGRAKRFRA